MQNTDTIHVYAIPPSPLRRFDSVRYSFRAETTGALVATISTRFALKSRLYWDEKRQAYSGNLVDVLCSKDGHCYEARDLLKLAHSHKMKSRYDQKSAYLIQSVDYLASENV